MRKSSVRIGVSLLVASALSPHQKLIELSTLSRLVAEKAFAQLASAWVRVFWSRRWHKGVFAMGEISKVALKRLAYYSCDKGKQFAATQTFDRRHPPLLWQIIENGRQTCAGDRKVLFNLGSIWKPAWGPEAEKILFSRQEIRQITWLIKTVVPNWMLLAWNPFDYFRPRPPSVTKREPERQKCFNGSRIKPQAVFFHWSQKKGKDSCAEIVFQVLDALLCAHVPRTRNRLAVNKNHPREMENVNRSAVSEHWYSNFWRSEDKEVVKATEGRRRGMGSSLCACPQTFSTTGWHWATCLRPWALISL